MHIEKVIQKLGYKRKEAQVYLAALFLGEASIADIAAKVKIARTSALVIVEKLYREGLMNYFQKRSRKYWIAESPEKLLQKIKEEEAALEEALPALQALRKHAPDQKPTVRVYNGRREIKFILDDIISTRKDFMCIVAWRDWTTLLGEEYLNDFIKNHSSHFLKARIITPQSDVAFKLKAGDRGQCRETRFLPEHTTSLNTATFIYGSKVAVISLNQTLPTGFLIEDPDVHNTMKNFFEELWHGKQP